MSDLFELVGMTLGMMIPAAAALLVGLVALLVLVSAFEWMKGGDGN